MPDSISSYKPFFDSWGLLEAEGRPVFKILYRAHAIATSNNNNNSNQLFKSQIARLNYFFDCEADKKAAGRPQLGPHAALFCLLVKKDGGGPGPRGP